MNRLMKLEKRPALPMSIRQIRYLVYVFVGCFLTLVLLSWAILLKYRLHEALDRQEILFRSQAEQLQSNLHTAEGMTLRAQGVLARLFEVGMEKPLASINTPQWVSRLQRRGDRQYMALPVSAGHQAIPAGEQLSTLADMLSFTFRVNNFQYRNVQNAYLFDVHADRFYVIPRRYGPARQLLGNDEAYQRFLGETRNRLRDNALMNRLYAAPDKVVMLEPTRDWASGVRVVTLVALVQLDGNPAAVLALDFPLSVVFPEARQTTERFALLTRDGTPLLRDDDAGPSSDRLLARALAERTSRSTGSQPVFILDGLLPRAALLEYPLDAWGWRVVNVVGVQALWGHFRQNTMWLLGLTGLSCILMLAWVRLVDRRIMRPTQMQSKRLQESETLGRTVIQSAGVGLMIVERDGGEVLLANDAARRIAERALPEDVKRLYQECSKALATREAGADSIGPLRFAFKLAKDDGQDCHLEVLLVETTYSGRAAWLCALNDISAAKQSEARLLEAIRAADAASRAKSSFLAMMSHEIRTPLNGMLGSIELLGLTPLEPRQRDQLAVMQQAAQSLIGIINDVLDFSKIEAQQMSVQPRPCLIDELVEDVTRRFAAEATRKNLRLLCAVDPSLTGPVLLDPLKVEQVLSNLVSNAVKFTEQGKVVVSVSKLDGPEPSLQIRVIDTGIGIAEENQHRLFEPFVQAEQSDSRRYGGTGLGLSICRRLVALMEGEIRLVSEPGLGSCFIVRLPLKMPDLSTTAEPEDPSTFTPVLDGLVVGLCITLRELYQATEQVLLHHGARPVVFDPAAPPATPVDVLICDSPDLELCPDADVVIDAMAPVQPDLMQTPIRAPQYAWRGLLRAISAAAGMEQPLPTALGETSAPQATRRLRVLLVEDHPINQVVMRQQLEWLGQHVDLAGDGPEALDLVASRYYDLILTDLQMPAMDGYTLARRLRERGVTVPIVAITASVGSDVREPCEAAGIDRCLTKPVLLSTLRDMLDGVPLGTTVSEAVRMPEAGPAETSLGDLLCIDLNELKQAMESGDAMRFAGRLHGLAGALATIGHVIESQACRWLEQSVRRAGLDAVGNDWPALLSGLRTLVARYENPDSAVHRQRRDAT